MVIKKEGKLLYVCMLLVGGFGRLWALESVSLLTQSAVFNLEGRSMARWGLIVVLGTPVFSMTVADVRLRLWNTGAFSNLVIYV